MPDKPLENAPARTVDDVLQYVRPAVRREKPYLVGGMKDLPVKLNQNESPFDLPEDFKRELLETYMAIPFNRYPDEHPDRLRNALAEKLGRSPAEIIIGNGSNELSYLLGMTLIERGVPVVLPRPMFSLYGKVARLFDAALTEVSSRPDFSFDVEAIREAVRVRRPALTVISTPNNPTGLALTLAEVERIVQEADGFVLVDEAYVEFNEEGNALGLLDRYPNLILMRTFSKAAGLAGLRLGYLAARPEVIREVGKARLPFVVDRMAEATGLALLKRPELLRERVEAMKASVRTLQEGLAAIDCVQVVPSQANFLIFRTPMEPAGLMARLAEAGVLVRDMSGYSELKGYLRVSAGTPAENQAFLDALKQALHVPADA